MIDLSKVRAIDVHVHADVSCHDPEDPLMGRFFDAASAYFKAPRQRPRIPEIIDLYRGQQIAFCLFTVDCESSVGARRVSNYEIAEYAARNDDIVIPFASIDPRKGRMGAREARDLIENHGVRGFKFHGIMQDIHPADPVAYPIYEVIAAHKLPAIFHTGHSGMGTGLPGGGGVRLKWGQPMLIDDVAVDFPDMKIDRKSTRLNSSHLVISYAVFCLKKKKTLYDIHASTPVVDHVLATTGTYVVSDRRNCGLLVTTKG